MSIKSFNRRSFMKALAATGIGAALVSTPVAAAMRIADAIRLGDKRFKLSETRFLMGTYVSITAIHESKDGAEQAIINAFSEVERLSAIFDRHWKGTPVHHLNETGRLTDAAPELVTVLKNAQDFYQRSNGAFDATVLPVVEMLKKNADPGGQINLSRSDIDDALALVDSASLHVSANEISFAKQGMGLTLDGIGKGFIVDRASDILTENGVENHLINAGGDIRARGERAAGQPWVIAIEDPAKKGRYPAVLQLKDAAVATSGGYEIYFDADRSFHHVVNPRTAMSPCKSISVSVTAPTVMEADALSTSAFVMSPKDGVAFVNGLENSECLILGSSGARLCSGGWEKFVRS
ncbi:FAD:protein FMN transferase [Maridesulfovibrio hydrothermalis]|uniref:FAD:protein FMN transferase n=1 Tax=Maridesulfovibrio hydrothermalis AM13 = DSM 14728 TaxID=1121451 RepID=L0RFG5_9BACT|nr:FAD:protein FMN transferase [Maridesulfovibrio hydrothermalis]CCO25489.1 ApbE family lipoprotein; Thiamin biosynthesis [Maridesulfovibrio hydrothermalis AM13 = DSM 14728]